MLPSLPAAHFDAVIHDPPAQALSGDLYSAALYAQIRRVVRPNGALFHYVGDPKSKASGRLFKGIRERLASAGFEPKPADAAYGIVGLPIDAADAAYGIVGLPIDAAGPILR